MAKPGKMFNGVGKDMDYSQGTTPLMYCRYELDKGGDFMKEWKSLSEKDKADLREAAIKEMNTFGIPVKAS